MDIKWKNRLKAISWVLLFTFGLKGFLSGLDLIANENDYLKNDYFETMQFESQLNEFIEYLTIFELNGVTKESAKQSITVSDSEIEEHRFRYGNLSDQIENITYQYEERIQQALNDGNEEVANIFIAERDAKIEDITNNFKDDDHVREKIKKEKEQAIDKYFSELENFRPQFVRYKEMFTYYLEDTQTGNVFTNFKNSDAETLQEKDMLYIESYPSSRNGYLYSNVSLYGKFNYSKEMKEWYLSLPDKTFTGQIGISKSIPASSPIMKEIQNYKQKQIVLLIIFLLSITALILSFYFYKKISIIQVFPIETWRQYYKRFPLDLRIISFLLTSMVLIALFTAGHVHYSLYYHIAYLLKDLLFLLVMSALFVCLVFIQGKFLLETWRDFDNLREEWKKSFVVFLYRSGQKMVTELFLIKSIVTQLFILLGFVGISFAVLFLVAVADPYLVAPLLLGYIVINIPILIFILRRTAYFNLIVSHVNELAQGNMASDLPIKGKSVFATLAKNVNTLKHGVKISQQEQAKSERLKTELITNVSHDLRTPLTSIITYTELLKGQDITNEDRNTYIEIIDRKSKRLKVLIDDLFEASKMASGNIELVKEKVDIVQLLQQTLAEYNEAIEKSTLQFRVTNPDAPVYAVVDGQKMWRVFDNLIGNILKYSLEQTRVYISVKRLHDQVEITFKNVTKYELGENIDELFERFKRGDTSRQTEGSGLGLAIAKSIVDLHQGQLNIDLDGDLFKVTVKLF